MKTMTVIFDGDITAPMGYASSKTSKKDAEKSTTYQSLPVMSGKFILPGEQLAGALRRAGLDDIRAAYPSDPLTSVLSFYQAAVGGIAGFGKSYKVGEMAALRQKNPFVSLWGKASLRGHLSLNHAVGPDTSVAVPVTTHDGEDKPQRYRRTSDRVAGFRSDDLARNPEMDVPENFWLQREVLRFAMRSSEQSKKVANHAETGSIWGFPVPIAAGSSQGVSLDEPGEFADAGEEGGKKLTNIQNGYGGFEYLPNETRFTHRFSVTGTEAEILMLMASFHGFARMPRLGGHWRLGLGWVDMQYTVYLREDDFRMPLREVGTLKINSHMENLDALTMETSGMVSGWMDAYLAWRREGFPGMDINAGVEDEEAVILDNLKKIATKARKDDEKSKAKKKKAELDHLEQAGQAEQEVGDDA